MEIDELEYFTSIEGDELLADLGDTHFKTRLLYLRAHNGFRRGSMHLFIGASGGGKSTLTRTVLLDILPNIKKKKLLLWLSEETSKEFKTELAKTSIHKQDTVLMDSMHIVSEQNHPGFERQQFLNELINMILSGVYDFLILDNITTSELYNDTGVLDQGRTIKKIRAAILKANIPAVLVAHTGGEVTESTRRVISANDVRGTKTIINLCQFIYILQGINIKDRIFQTLRIVKNRGADVKDKMFSLVFNTKLFLFTNERVIDFETFKINFKDRNDLNGK